MPQHPLRLRARPVSPRTASPSGPTPLSHALHAAMLSMALMLASASPPARAAEAAVSDSQVLKSYRIEAGPLGRALSAAAVNAGLALSFDPALTDALTSQALTGTFTARAAFARLLVGSGLEIVGRTDGSYTVRKTAARQAPATSTSAPADETVLPTVRVKAARVDGAADTAYRAKTASAGVLGDKALKDTPFSIEVYSRELLDNKQARSLSEVVKGDASVGLSVNTSVNEDNTLTVRGLGRDWDTGQKLDGLNLRSRGNDLPLEHVESVEILKGAGAFLYGFAAPGGIINYKLKRPTDEALRSISTQVTGSGQWLLHGDIGGRLGEDRAFGYRVNLVHEAGDTYVDGGSARRASGSVALDWRITPDLVWQVDALKARHTRRGAYWALYPTSDGMEGDWTLAQPPAPIDGSKQLAPSWSRNRSEHETYGTDLSWRIAPEWRASVAYRNSESGREFMQPVLFASASGDYSGRAWSYSTLFKSEQTQAQLNGKFSTGAVVHDVVVGATNTTTRSLATPDANTLEAPFGPGQLANPTDFANPVSVVGLDTATGEFSHITRREVFASDTLHLGADWDLIVGARHGRLQDAYSDYARSATTPTLAAIYRPAPWASVYASYVEALEEGAIAPEIAANAGQMFPPLVSKQREVGFKLDGNSWSANAALFELRQGLTYTTADNVFTQDGEARFRGVELSAKARLSRQWLATASAMWLDATNQKTDAGLLDGKHIAGVARQQASLYAEYSVPSQPLTLTAGAQYMGKRPIDGNDQWRVGSVTLFDFGARYVTQVGGKLLTLRLNVDNVANKAYWLVHAGGGSLNQGAPRTVKLGAQLEF